MPISIGGFWAPSNIVSQNVSQEFDLALLTGGNTGIAGGLGIPNSGVPGGDDWRIDTGSGQITPPPDFRTSTEQLDTFRIAALVAGLVVAWLLLRK